MRDYQVKTPADALAYTADCILATIETMAPRKTKDAREYKRQIDLAQKVCHWLQNFETDVTSTRASEIIRKSSVREWARKKEGI